MRKTLLLLCTLAALASAGAAQQAPWFFLQLSDPQFGMYEANAGFDQERANFEFTIATANRLHPAFVIVTGDMVNKAGEPEQIRAYREIARKLSPGIPIYQVAGNHDVGNQPTAESLATYRRNFGPDYFSFRSGNLAGLVLNSVIIHSPANVPEELAKQEKWLINELEKARQEGIRNLVVFQHHPFYVKEVGEPDQYFNIPLERRAKYLALLERYGVKYVFAGHYHRNAVVRTPALEVVTTGPVGVPHDKEGSGMRIAIVRESGIEHRFYGLGMLPNRIELK